ncbi:hypothetical protein OZX58_01435 [Lactobacillus sp. ESL0680]|uniref:DUF7149 domain-containing protein n=1 Tax=Lactobacillus sp. ESL0680 TaxID=2983210 RepID=UPI0023F798BD|nr:hypothetical protein [Lactobacillus sp. ESL0680]WEV38960.1 hypothetical protein OZX58_01435 [Lactobacillus sp. ESL0680]
MVELKLLDIKHAINKNVSTLVPVQDEKENFIDKINKFIKELTDGVNKNEEFQKGVFRNFLQNVIPGKQVNTSEKIDL